VIPRLVSSHRGSETVVQYGRISAAKAAGTTISNGSVPAGTYSRAPQSLRTDLLTTIPNKSVAARNKARIILREKEAHSKVRLLPSKLSREFENVLRGIEQSITPREFYRINNISPPEWINTEDDKLVVESTEQQKHTLFSVQQAGREKQYNFNVIKNSNKLNISPPNPFESVDFFLVGARDVDEINMECEFIDVTGTRKLKKKEITTGYFNDGSFIPVSFSFDTPIKEARISLDSKATPPSVRESLFQLYHRDKWKETCEPWLSVPSARESQEKPPILLISIDSLRYDHIHLFKNLINEMGSEATVPSEPRTQGYVTNSSHASTFTGVHPSKHGYYGSKGDGISENINPDLDTLPNLLARNQYKCSGIGSQKKIGPSKGFGDGMHRFNILPMSWMDRQYDATDIADTAIEWIRRDTKFSSHSIFYFLHFWDAHYPYLPPQPSTTDIDLKMVDKYTAMRPSDYLQVIDEDIHSFSENKIELLRKYYQSSLSFISHQIYRIIIELKNQNIFNNSLVIITADHGEEFLERGFPMHRTLYDANIRPGMIFKLPKQSSFEIPDEIDLIDIFPTISELIGGNINHRHDGQPLQKRVTSPRITERHGKEWYNVSIEIDGIKGIYTFEYEFPGRPGNASLDDGPVREEYYNISRVRKGEFSEYDPKPELKSELYTKAINFITSGSDYNQTFSEVTSSDAAERLEHLGYK
jgi:arylsulfatase A-like enzyme